MRCTPPAHTGALALLPLLVAAMAGPLTPAAARAQSTPAYDSTHFAGMEWRSIGPNRGGRSIASAGSASRPLEYYFGATGGGLWKTTDGGTTWAPVTDGKIRSSSVGAVAVAESNPDIVYIGMGETEFRGNIMQGDGVYKSTDGGKTWKHMGLEQTQAIARIRVSRTDPNLVYVAAFGHPFARGTERGVYRSRDGGATWQKVLFRDDRTAAIDIAIDPSDPSVLYASLWEAYRTPWTMVSGGPGSGLFKSTDGGDHWTELSRAPGMPKGVLGKIGVTVSGPDPRRVYAIVESDSGGVFRSDDAGATWKLVNGERKLRQRAFYYSRIYADPSIKDRVYVQNVGFYRSDDGGLKFDTTIRVPHGDNHDFWIAPNDSKRMIESNDGGATVSTNAGQTWTAEDFPTAQSYHVATTHEFPYHVCGAQQDNSTFCLPSSGWANLRGARASALGDWFYSVGGGESGYIAPDPKDPNIFYAGSQGALLTRYDRSNGQMRDVQVYPRFFSGEPASALPERWQWTFPIVFSPKDPNILYTSSQHLFKTTNEGQSWERISPDLTRADTSTLGLSGGPITHDMNGPEIYGTIFTIAPAPQDVNLIWTGSDDGLVQITQDGGKTWKNVTPPGLPKFARVSLIEASPHRAGTAYMAAKNYQMDDRAPYIYKTADFGKTWTKIVNGIRADDYVHAVREDTKRAGLLYAGTEHGIYASWDDGANWQPLGLNLPDVQVPDLVVEDNDLVIATHGRSMYVLDDIAPLRGLNAQTAAANVHLFEPRLVTKGENQAVFQYYLKRPADTVRVEILDGAGKMIRTFVGTRATRGARDSTNAARPTTPGDSAQRAKATPAAAPRSANDACDTGGEGRRGGRARAPTTRAGLNQFTWDLRYPGATVFECMILWSASAEAGPLAVPGNYQVRLSANGETQTQPFTIRLDPRLKGVTVADQQAQFDLAMKIRDKVSAANEGVIRTRQVKQEIADRTAKANAAPVTAAGKALAQKLSGVEEDLYQVRNRSGQDPLNFPIKLNNRLAALGRSVEDSDTKPTAGAFVVFKELSADLDVQLERLSKILQSDLSSFNALLTARKLEPVKTGPALTP